MNNLKLSIENENKNFFIELLKDSYKSSKHFVIITATPDKIHFQNYTTTWLKRFTFTSAYFTYYFCKHPIQFLIDEENCNLSAESINHLTLVYNETSNNLTLQCTCINDTGLFEFNFETKNMQSQQVPQYNDSLDYKMFNVDEKWLKSLVNLLQVLDNKNMNYHNQLNIWTVDERLVFSVNKHNFMYNEMSDTAIFNMLDELNKITCLNNPINSIITQYASCDLTNYNFIGNCGKYSIMYAFTSIFEIKETGPVKILYNKASHILKIEKSITNDNSNQFEFFTTLNDYQRKSQLFTLTNNAVNLKPFSY